MIHRIVGVPDGLKPGEYEFRFLRISGDIVLFEYAGPKEPCVHPCEHCDCSDFRSASPPNTNRCECEHMAYQHNKGRFSNGEG